MVTSNENTLLKRAIEALKTITAKGSLSEDEKMALEQIIHSNEPGLRYKKTPGSVDLNDLNMEEKWFLTSLSVDCYANKYKIERDDVYIFYLVIKALPLRKRRKFVEMVMKFARAPEELVGKKTSF
ncbi:hypothetical protein KW790_03460 [Candidatus Parcubacteria bacterium]|nr:hypothetical protein [Candidatus Parcubacteria bacterium]